MANFLEVMLFPIIQAALHCQWEKEQLKGVLIISSNGVLLLNYCQLLLADAHQTTAGLLC